MRLRYLTALVVAGLVPALAASQNPTELVIINANVLDVRTGQVKPNATVVLRDGKIASVETTTRSGHLNARGRFLIPGLIDAHTHIADLPALRRALESGVTTVRSAGVSHFVDVGLRNLVKTGVVEGPDVLAAGYHVRPQLSRDLFLSHPDLVGLAWDRGAAGPDAIRAVVNANLSHGVDWIKTTSTERAGLPDTDPRKQLYTEADVRVMVDEAAAKGIPVMAHAHGEEGAVAAVRAGVRSIEHGTYLSDEALRLMKEKGTYLVPTYATVIDLVEPGGDYNNPGLHLRGRHMLPRLRETTQRAIKLGVRIVTGADTSYGPNSVTRIAHEVAAFVDMGMTPLQALQSATITAAELLRIDSRTGAVEVGFEGDLVLVERNPLQHVDTLQDPLAVVSNGRVALDRSSFGKPPHTPVSPQ